jgi:hypothetical protein
MYGDYLRCSHVVLGDSGRFMIHLFIRMIQALLDFVGCAAFYALLWTLGFLVLMWCVWTIKFVLP